MGKSVHGANPLIYKLDEAGKLVEIRCCRCRQWKAVDQFAVRRANTISSRQSVCRWCQAGMLQLYRDKQTYVRHWVMFAKEDYDKVKRACRIRQETISSWVRQAIKRQIEEDPGLFAPRRQPTGEAIDGAIREVATEEVRARTLALTDNILKDKRDQ